MTRLWLVVALAALAAARPDTYRENEEFNYQRSSTDEGKKAGYYEAQRGNIGGNYERAHNMDTVAQGQMSDIVNQVGGQAGEVADATHGNLYGSAYSRGVYGQRQWDTANLGGRNFHDNAASHLASSSSAASQYGKSSALQYGQQTQGRLVDDAARTGWTADANTGSVGTSYGSRHSSSSGYQQHSGSSQYATNLDSFDQNAMNLGQTTRYRAVPVRIVVRPLTPVKVPVSAVAQEQIVDSSHSFTDEQRSRAHSQNSIIQNNDRVHTNGLNVDGLNGQEKHYESAYNYHKEWEKHSEVTPVPLSIVTSNPLSEHISSYNQQQEINQQNQYRSHSQSDAALSSGFATGSQDQINRHANVNERGYQSGYQYQRVAEPINNRYVVLSPTPEFVVTSTKHGSNVASQSQHASNYRTDSRSEGHAAYGDEARSQGQLRTNNDNLVALSTHNRDALTAISGSNGNLDSTEPKKYESSYSYHKSWERQGDPYVIVPASTGTVGHSENLQTSSNNNYGAHNSHYSSYGSHAGSHANQEDCDDTQRHVRSANYGDSTEDMGQHLQSTWQNQDDLGQQTVDLGQQVQSAWEPSSKPSASQGLSHLEDLGHQAQEGLSQQTEDLGQQVEGAWEKPTNHYGMSNIENLRENVDQQVQSSLSQEDFGQQTADLGQQVDSAWDKNWKLTHGEHYEANQHTQSQADINNEDVGQQVQINKDFEQQQQAGFEQTQMGILPEESLTTSNEYIRQIPKIVQNKHRQNKPQEPSFAHSDYEKNSEKEGNNYWEHNHQHVQHSSVNSEQQRGWEQISQQQHQSHYYRHYNGQEMQQNWKPLTQEDESEYNRNWDRTLGYSHYSGNHRMSSIGKTEDFGQKELEGKQTQENHEGQTSIIYGYRNTDAINSWKPTQTVSSNQNVNINKAQDNEPTILRGDLGTDAPVDLPTTTINSLTDDEIALHLSGILSNVNKSKDNKSKENRNIFPEHGSIFIQDKVKTPEEIESLSLLRGDTSHPSNPKNVGNDHSLRNSQHQTENSGTNTEKIKKITDSEQISQHNDQIDYINKENKDSGLNNNHQNEHMGQELEGQNNDQQTVHYGDSENNFGQSQLNLGQELESFGQQFENENQKIIKNEHTNISSNREPTNRGQQLYNSNQYFERGYQQSISVNKSTENIETNLRDSTNKPIQSTNNGHYNNNKYSSFSEPVDIGQKPITTLNYEFNKDRDEAKDKNQKEEQQAVDVGQKVQNLKQSPDMAQELLSFDQRTTDLGQETEDFKQSWREAGQETYNLDQQTDDFGQQAESLNQHLESKPFQRDQQSEDLGQQVQSFDAGTNKSEKSELEHPPLEIGQQDGGGSIENLDQKVIGLDKNEDDLPSPLVQETSKTDSENPGFWKKVGSKLTSAKDKVSCRFSKC